MNHLLIYSCYCNKSYNFSVKRWLDSNHLLLFIYFYGWYWSGWGDRCIWDIQNVVDENIQCDVQQVRSQKRLRNPKEWKKTCHLMVLNILLIFVRLRWYIKKLNKTVYINIISLTLLVNCTVSLFFTCSSAMAYSNSISTEHIFGSRNLFETWFMKTKRSITQYTIR